VVVTARNKSDHDGAKYRDDNLYRHHIVVQLMQLVADLDDALFTAVLANAGRLKMREWKMRE